MGFRQRISAFFSSLGSAEGYRRYAKNTGWLMAENAVRMGLGLVIGVWVARYLGPRQYGMFNYAASLVGLFAGAATLGIGNILVRDLTASPEAAHRLLGTAMVLRLAGAASAVFLIWLLNLAMRHDPLTHMLITILSLTILLQSGEVFELYFRSRVWARYIALASMTALVTAAGARVGLILFEQPLVWFAVVVVGDMLLSKIGMGVFYLKTRPSVGWWTVDPVVARRMLRDSWPLLFAGILVSIYMKIDQVMIQRMLGDTAVGYYSAAVRISEACYFIPVLVCNSLFPAIVASRQANEDQYRRRMIGLYRALAIMSVVICLPISLSADSLAVWIFGSAYSPAGGVMRLHAWSLGFVGVGVAGGNWLLTENLQRYQLLFTGLGAAANIGANLILIPRWGINGAAVATLLSYGLSAYMGLSFFAKTRTGFWAMTQAIFFYRKGHP